jgi:hypothetical protein
MFGSPIMNCALISGGGIDPLTADLIGRFTTPPSSLRRKQINAFMVALKNAGVIPKLDGLYVHAAETVQALQQNWIQNLYNLTPSATAPTFTADRGSTGNTSTASYGTGFNPTTAVSPKFTLNSASMGVWVNSDVNEDKSDMGNANALLRARRGATLLPGYRANDTTTRNGNAISDGLGLTAWTRTASNAIRVYKNGAVNATATFASVALSNEEILIHTSGAGLYNSKRIALSFFGGDLTDNDHLAIYNAANTYLTAIGAFDI